MLNILGSFDFQAAPTGIYFYMYVCMYVCMSPVIGSKPCAPAPHSYQYRGRGDNVEHATTTSRVSTTFVALLLPRQPTANGKRKRTKINIVQRAVVIVYDIICNDSHCVSVCSCVWGKL